MKLRHSFYLIGFSAVALITIVAPTLQAQDPLNSWAHRVVPGLATNLNAVAFGNGAFVAVGDGSTVARSTDGESWTVNIPGAFGDLAGVRFLNGEFIAVGSSNKILFSTDGISWTQGTLPNAGNWDIAYGNGIYLVAGSSTLVSNNGADWAVTTPRINVPLFGLQTAHLESIAFGNGRFVGLPQGGATGHRFHGVYSTNGVDWIEGGNAPTTSFIQKGDLLFAGGIFVGLGSTLDEGSGSVSADGAVWCCGFGGGLSNDRGVGLAYGQGNFLWVERLYSYQWPLVYSSTNGTSWVSRFAPDPMTPEQVAYYQTLKGQARGATFGNGTFVVVGDNGYILQSGNIGGAPLILEQPQDRAVLADNPATFSVTMSGAMPLAFQWYRTNSTMIVNETNTSYTIPHVMPSDSGGYWAVITNSFGSVTSRVAQLSVSFLNISNYAGIALLGVVGRTYRIEATSATGPPNWLTLTNVVLPASPFIWIDYGSPAAGQRLYRAAELP